MADRSETSLAEQAADLVEPKTRTREAPRLVLLPLVAMRFTSEVVWTGSDFVFAAVMLGSVGLGLELAVRKRNRAYTMAAAVALLVSFLSFWFTGAVGIIGNEGETSNMLFLAVIAVALAGSAVALFRPKGMAAAMCVAATAQRRCRWLLR